MLIEKIELLLTQEDKMKKIAIFAACLSLLIAGQSLANDLSFNAGLTQDEFKDLSNDAVAALSYKNTAPAAPLGIAGFDIGIEGTYVEISTENNNYWDKAFSDDPPSMLVIPKIRARKGLPVGIDIGAMYAGDPGSNIKLYGAEVSYAFLEGSVATPALGVRGTYTKLSGVDDLDFQTAGIDISISKGFAIITPYAGAGMVYFDSKAKGNLQSLSTLAGSPLGEEKMWQPRYFAGLEISPIPLFGVTVEVEYLNSPVYSLKLALSF
jgi:hypothetical protein